MEKQTYRAVDSDGREFEVAMAKHSQPAGTVAHARAPSVPVSFQSRPAAVQSGAR